MTERENKMLRDCYKILDYKLGTLDAQLNALSRQTMIYDKRRVSEEDLITHRMKIVTILRNGDQVEIDRTNNNQVDIFLKLRSEGLVEIKEIEPKKYLATWRIQ